MCGIVGYVGHRPAKDLLLEALQRLEYRGYDSAGIALLESDALYVEKRAGKVRDLIERLRDKSFSATVGLGHTRWATHGPPTDSNAHPHSDEQRQIAVIHNGIIENYLPFKEELQRRGHRFASQTDSEVIAHLIEERYDGGNLFEAVREVVQHLRGAYAIAVMARDNPNEIVVARQGSPLVVGLGQNETFAASDIPTLLSFTRQMLVLHDGEIAVLRRNSAEIYDFSGRRIERAPQQIHWDVLTAQKQGYKHFMLKEIHEQPQAVAHTLQGRYDLERGQILLPELEALRAKIQNAKFIYLTAMGTAYYAALEAKYLWRYLLDLPLAVEMASEFRYSQPYLDHETLVIAISQSGETADTLGAVRMARERGATVISIVNVVGATLTRESDATLYTHAGPEIGVASTKAFLAQLAALNLLGFYIAQVRGKLASAQTQEALSSLAQAPVLIEKLLQQEQQIAQLAQIFYQKEHFLFLGRDLLYPIALEGALKLKEISYIHAEGYAAGELKHGPIALIDPDMPTIVLVTKNSVYEKVLSNIQEVRARRGVVIAVTDEVQRELEHLADFIIEVPAAARWVTPMLFVVPLQLFAYHIADLRGTDIDQPRNLAKSVTVE
ncbi:MAG: glutamine--fructose-6-phosphate transaminase (isomerizing) [Candidatus Bipolaricaulota bacterium]|nr:glutamine--fructose-6-phosphate transaminase (isomerizing) [Candidatus Bipolaricaulota bacterium]MCS7274346.1 glutamine--fructose-6-phosphate transaminase (isomerizing) [Candidatus Bipolaricaulota bacterium]MDW8110476.1 glutamine--fructose-6-phosphate transaminase (isomerizing) [Candidatus Bipolaricaulota bacterium]MDW8329157.1 glutamine--fructose-6-phosphate transaminase (isomerizing) [Candidatus Bipolaricaulota bacterium]